ncbi:MAG: hypothetical protein PS018_11650 [bacterium]|nr:hypothetical protein [bacterium]
MDILAKLDELAAAGDLKGFTIWPTRGGYQANLSLQQNSWRVRIEATPGAAVVALFDGGPLELTDGQGDMLAEREFEPELPAPDESVFD